MKVIYKLFWRTCEKEPKHHDDDYYIEFKEARK